MVSVAWSPSREALLRHHECALSQVGIHPDMTLDVARMLSNRTTNKSLNKWEQTGWRNE